MSSVNSKESIKLTDAIRMAIEDEMNDDADVFLMGLGVNDPGGVFGTTIGLKEKFGSNRVFETPTAENGMTGIAVGAAIAGSRPISVHQRFDFFLLAMDQLVNSAAKWHFMFGGQFKVPLVIRLVVGRGWGQGATHSQNLHSWLTHIPGLRVVSPSSPQAAYDLMRMSIRDNNPVVFIEHRWIHGTESFEFKRLKPVLQLSEVSDVIIAEGNDVTIAATGIGTLEALGAQKILIKMGVSAEIVDIQNLTGNLQALYKSAKSTGKLVIVDHGLPKSSYGSWLASKISLSDDLRDIRVRLLTYPNYPEPTSRGLLSNYHPDISAIVNAVFSLGLGTGEDLEVKSEHSDVPDSRYKGPF
jgi:pyruvate dehydrogenase E1 component beta subunit